MNDAPMEAREDESSFVQVLHVRISGHGHSLRSLFRPVSQWTSTDGFSRANLTSCASPFLETGQKNIGHSRVILHLRIIQDSIQGIGEV